MSGDYLKDDDLAWAKRILTEKMGHCGCGSPSSVYELIDDAGLIDHGSNIAVPWPTDEGRKMLAILDGVDLEKFADDGHAFVTCPDCQHPTATHQGGKGFQCDLCDCAEISARVSY